jgi:hypothetical protein
MNGRIRVSRSGSPREVTRNAKVEAALQNEYVTRQRVDVVEHKYARLQLDMDKLDAFLEGSFWTRLGWLFTGKH